MLSSFLGSLILALILFFVMNLVSKTTVKRAQFRWKADPGGTASLEWKGKGEVVKLGRYEITGPLTYFSDGIPMEGEPSCIDRTLPIGDSANAEKTPYYPWYSGLSPDQRAAYLEWLASGRQKLPSNLGYVFILFYGFERRLLLQNQDVYPILDELIRLLNFYLPKDSFNYYLSRLVLYVIAQKLHGIAVRKTPDEKEECDKLNEDWFQRVDQWLVKLVKNPYIKWRDENLAVVFAWLVVRKQPISSEWALKLAKHDPRSKESIVLKRMPDQFSAQFTKKFNERFPQGFNLEATKKELQVLRTLNYEPANPSSAVRGEFKLFKPLMRIPDMLRLRDRYAPVVDIWNESISDLKHL